MKMIIEQTNKPISLDTITEHLNVLSSFTQETITNEKFYKILKNINDFIISIEKGINTITNFKVAGYILLALSIYKHIINTTFGKYTLHDTSKLKNNLTKKIENLTKQLLKYRKTSLVPPDDYTMDYDLIVLRARELGYQPSFSDFPSEYLYPGEVETIGKDRNENSEIIINDSGVYSDDYIWGNPDHHLMDDDNLEDFPEDRF